MNYGIVAAIIVQAIIRQFSLIAGAIAGFIITTGILIWGLSVYAEGDVIALAGELELSQPIFIVLCLAWYGFDTWEFFNAKKITDKIKDILSNPAALEFAQKTVENWASGKYSQIGDDYAKKAKNLSPTDFLKGHLLLEELPLGKVFKDVGFRNDEIYLDDSVKRFPNMNVFNVEYVITDKRLIYKKKEEQEFTSISWTDVDSVEKLGRKEVVVRLKDGNEITFPVKQALPDVEILQQYRLLG
jgi:hypothetical protein